MNLDLKFLVSNLLLVLRYAFCVFHQIYVYSTGLSWILLFWPLKTLRSTLFWGIFNPFLEMLIDMVTWYTWSAGYGVVEMGDDISPCLGERTLVLLNHQTPVDIILFWNAIVSRQGMFEDCLWIMNEEFKYAPFGIFSVIRKDFFIPIGREKRAQGLTKLKNHLETWYEDLQRKWIMLFPEGGFLHKRRAKSQKYALEHNLPVLQNVCLPRLGATKAIIEVFNKSDSSKDKHSENKSRELKWILDVTIVYPGGIPLSLSTMVGATRPPFNTTVIYRLYPASQVSCSPDLLPDWLYSRWQEKDNILSEFYETGTVSTENICPNPVPPRLVTKNPLKQLLSNVFILLSFCGFCKIFCLFLPLYVIITFLVTYLVFVALKITKVI